MPQNGGYIVPRDYWYGGFKDIPAPGLRAWAWRAVGTVASGLGIDAGYGWFYRGMTRVYCPGLVEKVKMIERRKRDFTTYTNRLIRWKGRE